MVTADIREFVGRDWDEARTAKDRYWAERVARLGPREGFRAADELRRQAIAANPGWPDVRSRDDDLAAHQKFTDLLARADAAGRA